MPFDVRVLSFMPHMHLRGKDFKYTFTRPGESPETVLSVPAFDFAWQTYYVLEDPIELPKGLRHRLPGALRQLRFKPLQSRLDQDGALG